MTVKHHTAIFVVCVALLISGAIWIFASHMGNSNEQKFRHLCDQLDAQFVKDPEWLCIRDHNIVYGDKP